MKKKITIKEVFVNDFYSDDWSEAVVKALDSVGRHDAVLRFPGSRCEFCPHPELTRYAAISNHNSNREHPFAIILDGCENIELAGEPGTEFIMSERSLVPIRVSNCRNVVLRNISIDFSMDIYIQAKVVRSENDLFELELETPCEVALKNGILHFNGEAFFGAAEVEPETLGLRHGTALNFREDYPTKIPVEILTKNRIRFSGQLRQMPPAGIRMTLRCGKRTTPAVFIEKSEQVRLADITVYQAAGMGVIAQASKDIYIDGFCVKIAPGSNRCYSISADALHFVNCYGNLRIENCLLENEYDDAVNIHGIYSIAEKAVSPIEWLVRRPHPAQAGVPLGISGNRFRAVDTKTLATICEFRAERIEEVDDRYIRLTSNSTSIELPEGAALENLDWRFSEVVIKNNIMRYGNPRGILVSAGEHVVIENNFIDVPYAAIVVPGDAMEWYESGFVSELIIRNNTINSGYGAEPVLLSAAIDVCPHIMAGAATVYHGRIVLDNNKFINTEFPETAARNNAAFEIIC